MNFYPAATAAGFLRSRLRIFLYIGLFLEYNRNSRHILPKMNKERAL